MNLKIRGSDDTITEEEIKSQIERSGGGSVDDIKFNKLMYTTRGWRIRFKCTKT